MKTNVTKDITEIRDKVGKLKTTRNQNKDCIRNTKIAGTV